MPRVGSSRRSSLGAEASMRARSTFCWLPPESSATFWSGPDVLMRRRLDELGDAARPGVARTRSRAGRGAGRTASDDVVPHRQVGHDALGLAVLGEQGDAGRDGGARAIPPRAAGPSIATVPCVERLLAEDRLGGRRAPRAEQAGQADDLAPMDRHVDIVDQHVAPGQAARLEHRPVVALLAASSPKLVTPRAGTSTIVAAEHRRRSARSRSISATAPLWTRRPSRRTVTAVAELEDLVEPVGDVDHGHPAGPGAGR